MNKFVVAAALFALILSTAAVAGPVYHPPGANLTYGDVTPLLPAGAIALLTVGVNFVVDWFLHKSSGLRDDQ